MLDAAVGDFLDIPETRKKKVRVPRKSKPSREKKNKSKKERRERRRRRKDKKLVLRPEESFNKFEI